MQELMKAQKNVEMSLQRKKVQPKKNKHDKRNPPRILPVFSGGVLGGFLLFSESSYNHYQFKILNGWQITSYIALFIYRTFPQFLQKFVRII